jgi:hypothetical protein
VPRTVCGEVLGHRARRLAPGCMFGSSPLQIHLSPLHKVLDLDGQCAIGGAGGVVVCWDWLSVGAGDELTHRLGGFGGVCAPHGVSTRFDNAHVLKNDDREAAEQAAAFLLGSAWDDRSQDR